MEEHQEEVRSLPPHERLVDERTTAGQSDSDDDSPQQATRNGDDNDNDDDDDLNFNFDDYEDEDSDDEDGDKDVQQEVGCWSRTRRRLRRFIGLRNRRKRIQVYDGSNFKLVDRDSIMAPKVPTKEIIRALTLFFLGIVFISLGGWILGEESEWFTRGLLIVILGFIMFLPGVWYSVLVIIAWLKNDWTILAHVDDD